MQAASAPRWRAPAGGACAVRLAGHGRSGRSARAADLLPAPRAYRAKVHACVTPCAGIVPISPRADPQPAAGTPRRAPRSSRTGRSSRTPARGARRRRARLARGRVPHGGARACRTAGTDGLRVRARPRARRPPRRSGTTARTFAPATRAANASNASPLSRAAEDQAERRVEGRERRAARRRCSSPSSRSRSARRRRSPTISSRCGDARERRAARVGDRRRRRSRPRAQPPWPPRRSRGCARPGMRGSAGSGSSARNSTRRPAPARRRSRAARPRVPARCRSNSRSLAAR